jgi:AcrR family transcriptional regulator
VIEQQQGRRERKKAATRKAISDAALDLFMERGYDQVSLREIADAADVSTTTIFKHFTGKEALIFDDDEEIEALRVAQIRDRPAGQSVIDALHQATVGRLFHRTGGNEFPKFLELVRSTPALSAYANAMWMRHERAVAAAIAEEIGAPADDPSCLALTHFALDAITFARDASYPRETLGAAFEILKNGWQPGHR